MSEQNKVIVQEVVSALNKLDWNALSEVMAEDIINELKQDPLPIAFPDATLTILDQIAEGDKVATRGKMTGTHEGVYQGVAPTGRQCFYTYIAIDRIENGKVVESWFEWDPDSFLQQIRS